MSKRQREKRSSRYYCEGLFMGLPRELWQRLIYPLVGLQAMLRTATVSREWKAQLFASISEFSHHTLSYTRLSLSTCHLTRGYLTQLCNLSTMQVDLRVMRSASAFAGLAQLTSLRTLCLSGESFLANQASRLTQITALDDCTSFGGSDQALMPPNLRLFRVATNQPSSYHLNNLSSLVQLTYLDLRYSSMYRVQHSLTAFTALQFLALGRGAIESYDFLTCMRSLVFLDMDSCSGPYCGQTPSSDQLMSLTALTYLSVVGMPVALTTVQAMTQLRSLRISDDDSEHPRGATLFSGCITLQSLTWEHMSSLRHLCHLGYKSHNIFQRLTPLKVLEFGLSQESNEMQEVAAFRGWHHKLPENYFDPNRAVHEYGRFLNGAPFV